MLEARGAVFSRALDLYAGTGALGIEALSRGAEFADFVERDPGMCSVIESNLQSAGFRARAKVHRGSLPAVLRRLTGQYGLIFADPPYELAERANPLAGICDSRLVDEYSTIVYEHGRRTIPPEACGSLERIVTRAHGSSAFSLYRALIACDAGGG